MRTLPVVVVALLTVGSNALAEEAPRIPLPPLAPATAEESAGPNRALLTSGGVLLGGAYVGSVIVAGTSTHAADDRLYIPVAGPWLDLAERGGCPARSSCVMETSNKIVLIGDGIVQGFGLLEIVGAFVFPEKRFVAGRVGRNVIVSPASIGVGGVGVAAVGAF